MHALQWGLQFTLLLSTQLIAGDPMRQLLSGVIRILLYGR